MFGATVLPWWADRESRSAARSGVRTRVAGALVAGFAFGVLALRTGADALLPAFLTLMAAGTAISIVDLREKRIPNRMLLVAAPVVAVLLTGGLLLGGEPARLLAVPAGAAAMFVLYFLIALIAPAAMGMGDVKLATLLGGALGAAGLTAWLVGLLAAFLIGGVAAVIALGAGRLARQHSVRPMDDRGSPRRAGPLASNPATPQGARAADERRRPTPPGVARSIPTDDPARAAFRHTRSMTLRRILPLLALPLAATVLLASCSTTLRPDRFDSDPSTSADDLMAVPTDCALLVPSAADRSFAQVTVDPQYEDDSDLAGVQRAGGTVCFFADPDAGTVYHVGVQLIQGYEAERRERRWERDDLLAVDGVGEVAYFTAISNEVNGDSSSELRVLTGDYYVQVGAAPSADVASLMPFAIDAVAALG